MKKSLKKQIKQDEFVTGYERTLAWFRTHQEEARASLIGGVILAGVIGGLFYFRADRQRSAAKAFGEALEIFDAPVQAERPAGAAGSAFATKDEKFNRAMTAFDGVVQRHGSLAIGRRARYYAALCRIELNRLDEAEKMLQEAAKSKDFEADLARLKLADVELQRGAADRAIEAYKRLVEETQSSLPKDHVLMRLASVLEQAGRVNEAAAAYRRLTLEFPESEYVSEAERRADFLHSDGRS